MDPWRERDACGVGFVARADGARTHEVLQRALTAVARLAHRGAAATDSSGDGAGILAQIPRRLLAPPAAAGDAPFALGMIFLPRETPEQARAVARVEDAIRAAGLAPLGWRDVPVDTTVLGPLARTSAPSVRQVFVSAPAEGPDDEAGWERRLYRARRAIERDAACFVCSLSCRTVVYKALLTGPQLPAFYPDLRDPRFETAMAVFHQRYSTNTLPSWPLAQPFRLLAHNGEINTLWGNRNAMRAREAAFPDDLKPVIWEGGSDSASLDNALDLLVRSGRDVVHALMMLMPEAWENTPDLDPALRAFYEVHAGLMEPWDGPAALAFSDGVLAGSAVDRNGLRPCRYKITADGLVIAASEAGVADLDPARVVESGRLGPGELLVVDTASGRVVRSAEAKRAVARRYPYHRSLARIRRELPAIAPAVVASDPAPDLLRRQRALGYGFEDVRFVLSAMADTGKDAIWSMGDDTPIPPLSRVPQSVYAYVRQRFAQVTNPPIDPLREARVMSLVMYLGRRGSLLAGRPGAWPLLRLEHPVLLDEEMASLRQVGGFLVATLAAVWDVAAGPGGLAPALDDVGRAAARAVRQGATLLVLSDRALDARRAPLPMLLAVGAVHQALLRAGGGLRGRVGLVAEAGDAWDVHHVAALFGYGADAVHPWLALASLTTGGGTRARPTAPRPRRACSRSCPRWGSRRCGPTRERRSSRRSASRPR